MKKKLAHWGLVMGSVFFSFFLFFLLDLLLSPFTKLESISPANSPLLQKDHGWYQLKPNFIGRDQIGNRQYEVWTDPYGFRKKPHTQFQGNYEVIFLGDSFTYGVNGPWEETFVGMFAEKSGLSVINAGVPSYSPTPYLYQYQRALQLELLAKNHTVVIGLDISDVYDEAVVWKEGQSHPEKRSIFRGYQKPISTTPRVTPMKIDIGHLFPLTRLIVGYIRHRLFSNNLKKLSDLTPSAFTFRPWSELDKLEAPLGYAPSGVAMGLKRIELNLKEIISLAHKNDSKVYLLIYPWPAQISHADQFDWSLHVKQMCQRLECNGVIDLIPTFRERAKTHFFWLQKYYFSGDFHFSKNGNLEVASGLIESLAPGRE